MKKLLLVAALIVGLSGLAQAQVLMPGPSALLLNAVTSTGPSVSFPNPGYGIVTFLVGIATGSTTVNNATATVVPQGSLDGTNFATLGCWEAGTTSRNISVATVGQSLLHCQADGVPVVRLNVATYATGGVTGAVGVSAMPRTR